ncbi:MAG: peptidylprolyl isomerase [Nostoc sp. DedQUE12a]|nr:peptidylprolyl isomerase [Nostoc sp. DedQUE12a]
MRLKISQFLLSVAIASALMLGACSTQQVASNSTSSPTSAATSNASETTTKTTTEATPVSQSTNESVPGFANLPRLEGKATVVLTVKGSPITIEVDGTNAPITAGNFVDLVQRGVYNGLAFHRVERGTPEQPQPFVVQGGDPQSKDPNFPVDQLGTGSYIDPKTGNARYIPLEIKQKGSNTPIYNQTFDATAQPVLLPHKQGAVAMARSQQPDSASSQFYFALADVGFLDGKYAVFGNVTQGFDVVNKIQQGDRIDSAKVTQGAENLKTPAQ